MAGASTTVTNHAAEMILEPAVGHSTTLFITANSSGSNIGAEFQDATLCGGWCSLGTNTYDNVNNRYIRIRHNELNDIIYFEASPDGSAWFYFDAVARPYSLTATKTAIIGGGYEAGIGGPVNSSFDNFSTTGQ